MQNNVHGQLAKGQAIEESQRKLGDFTLWPLLHIDPILISAPDRGGSGDGTETVQF